MPGRRDFGFERLGDPDQRGREIVGIAEHSGLQREPRPNTHGSSPWGFGHWSQSVPILCGDGKYRRVPATPEGKLEPSLFPLAPRLPARVGKLRGSGNAIVPQVAAVFLRACLDALREEGSIR